MVRGHLDGIRGVDSGPRGSAYLPICPTSPQCRAIAYGSLQNAVDDNPAYSTIYAERTPCLNEVSMNGLYQSSMSLTYRTLGKPVRRLSIFKRVMHQHLGAPVVEADLPDDAIIIRRDSEALNREPGRKVSSHGIVESSVRRRRAGKPHRLWRKAHSALPSFRFRRA